MRAVLRKSLIRLVPTWLHPHLRNLQFRATPLIGGVLRCFPGSSRRFGPPRHIATALADYVVRLRRDGTHGATYRRLRDGEAIHRALPRLADGQVHFEFFNEITRLSPPVGLASLANGRVLGRSGAVIGPDDTFIADVSATFFSDDPAAHPLFLSPKLPRVTRLEGVAAVLTTFRSNIYYHWILDTLPRLQLLQDAGVSYDKLVVPARSRFQRESLALLGLAEERILSDPGLHLEAATLVVPTLPGFVGNPPGWACAFLRRSFLPHLGERGANERRIYIARGKGATRRILNEEELLRMLQREGFEIVNPETMSFVDQVALFDEAQIVVAAHGSGLANLVFCREGAHVIELFSPHYVTVPYWALANQVGLEYRYVMGEGGWDPARGRGRRIHDDIRIDVAQVQAVLREIDAAPPGARRSPGSTGARRHAAAFRL